MKVDKWNLIKDNIERKFLFENSLIKLKIGDDTNRVWSDQIDLDEQHDIDNGICLMNVGQLNVWKYHYTS
jgi:hypothetical protein